MKRAKKILKNEYSKTVSDKTKAQNATLTKKNDIISDEHVAAEFFFVEMLPKMKALADSYNRSFGLDIIPEDVCRATYLSCWENNWAKLNAFKGETTIHSWVAKIASQATYQFLVDDKYIDGVGNTKAKNYRLTIRSIEDDNLRQEIVDLVFIPELHYALELYYVKKCNFAALASYFGSEDKAKTILKTAEKALIEQLINTENAFAEMALSSRKAIKQEIPLEAWHNCANESEVSENQQTLRDILMCLYKNDDWDKNAMILIKSIIAEMGWTSIQKEVWTERFFNETPSAELALRFHVRNTWIDNTYSRLNKQFRIAVKSWWEKYC